MTKKSDTAAAASNQEAVCPDCTLTLDAQHTPTMHARFVLEVAKKKKADAAREAEAKAKAEAPIPYTLAPIAEPIPKWSSATTTPATTAPPEPKAKAKPFAFPARTPPPLPRSTAAVPGDKSVEARLGDWARKGAGGWTSMPNDLYFALPAGATRDVAFYLARRLGHDGATRPTSVRLIATETRLDRRTVQRALTELARFGFDSYQDEGLDGLAAKRYTFPTPADFFGLPNVVRPPRARRGKVNRRKVAESLCALFAAFASL